MNATKKKKEEKTKGIYSEEKDMGAENTIAKRWGKRYFSYHDSKVFRCRNIATVASALKTHITVALVSSNTTAKPSRAFSWLNRATASCYDGVGTATTRSFCESARLGNHGRERTIA